jgi:alpha-1,6-mannosyltransferase
VPVLIHPMRVVQVANFYGPRSGGLRTAVDRLGAEYCAAGHEAFLVVPGRYSDWHELPSGVVRISLPARLIPFTGGYRAVLPGPVTSLLGQLSPDALEVSDRLTLLSLGGWGRRHDVGTVMISHERLDRLVGQILPARIARSIANVANRRTAATYDAVVCTTAFAREEFDRIHAMNVMTVPLGVDLDQFHPRRHSAAVRKRWAQPDQTLLVHCGRLSVEKHAHRSIDTVAALRDSGVDARLVVVGEGPMRTRLERQATGLPVDFTGFIGCRDTVATILATADVALAPGPHETFGLAALEALASGTPAVVVPHVGARRNPDHRQRGHRRQRPGRHRPRGHVDHQQARGTAPQQRTPSRRTVHLAPFRGRDAQRVGRRLAR